MGNATARINQTFKLPVFRELWTLSVQHIPIFYFIFISLFKSRVSTAWNKFFSQRWTQKPQALCSLNAVNPMEILHSLEKLSEVHPTQRNPLSHSFYKNGVLWSIIIVIIINTCKKGKVRSRWERSLIIIFSPYVLIEWSSWLHKESWTMTEKTIQTE